MCIRDSNRSARGEGRQEQRGEKRERTARPVEVSEGDARKEEVAPIEGAQNQPAEKSQDGERRNNPRNRNGHNRGAHRGGRNRQGSNHNREGKPSGGGEFTSSGGQKSGEQKQ